jgi:hypothetical protein
VCAVRREKRGNGVRVQHEEGIGGKGRGYLAQNAEGSAQIVTGRMCSLLSTNGH